MGLAIIDAREWQNTFDLETGQKREEKGLVAGILKEVLNRNPYPGDIDATSNQWVTETTLDLIKSYDPQLVCLSYVHQFFANRHFQHDEKARDELFASAMSEARSFIDQSGYTPVVIGSGDMVPLLGTIDLSGIDGLAISSNWSARYCGLHKPSKKDFSCIQDLKAVDRIVSKKEWIALFEDEGPAPALCDDPSLMPDYLVISKQGYAFKTMGTTLRNPVSVLANNFTVPVYTPLGRIQDIREIRHLVRSNLGSHKIALIIIEGVGRAYFPDSSFECVNAVDWFCNESGDSFYLTLSTGTQQPFAYPPGYRYFDQDEESIQFPFSGYLTREPENTLAKGLDKRSIAVGNRSMFMHMMFGVDLSIECFARNLFNQGVMGVVAENKLQVEGQGR